MASKVLVLMANLVKVSGKIDFNWVMIEMDLRETFVQNKTMHDGFILGKSGNLKGRSRGFQMRMERRAAWKRGDQKRR